MGRRVQPRSKSLSAVCRITCELRWTRTLECRQKLLVTFGIQQSGPNISPITTPQERYPESVVKISKASAPGRATPKP